MIFTTNLKRLRLDNNISQEKLAEKIGVSKQRILQWESGQSYPEIEEYIAISHVFHVDIDYLLKDRCDYNSSRVSRKRERRAYRFHKVKQNIKGLLIITIFVILCYIGYYKIRLNNTNLNYNVSEKTIDTDYSEVHNEYIEQLSEMADNTPQISSIINNVTEYPTEILDLLIRNPETVDFALDYLNRKDYGEKINISDDYEKGEIPLLLQWDKRWGYSQYGNNIMAINGCGPTCLSMVAIGLTGDTSLNPKIIADYSEKVGFIEGESGTSWLLMSEGAKHFGLEASEIILDEGTILRHLKERKPIIVSVRPGDFTTTGHFIVLRDVTAEGKVLVYDPNSIELSNKEWDLKTIMAQARNLWSFSKIK